MGTYFYEQAAVALDYRDADAARMAAQQAAQQPFTAGAQTNQERVAQALAQLNFPTPQNGAPAQGENSRNNGNGDRNRDRHNRDRDNGSRRNGNSQGGSSQRGPARTR